MNISYETQVSYDEEEGWFKYTVTISNLGSYWTSPEITIDIYPQGTPTQADWAEAQQYAKEQTERLAEVLSQGGTP